jgi:peptidoglycan/xylan/chitin deacetylase (PgdA/CDA1 family)
MQEIAFFRTFSILCLCLGGIIAGVLILRHPKQPIAVAQTLRSTIIFERPTPTPKQDKIFTDPVPNLQGTHIIMYHYVRSGINPQKDYIGYRLSVSSSELDQHITYLEDNHYRFITMHQPMQGEGGPDAIVLTFDDGYEDFYTAAYPIIKKHAVPATTYIVTAFNGGDYMTQEQLREISDNGIEIGAHTVDHKDLSTQSIADQTHEIMQSKLDLENIIHKPILAFCYPSGKYTVATRKLVQQAGYESATTTYENALSRTSDRFSLARVRALPGEDLKTAFDALSIK